MIIPSNKKFGGGITPSGTIQITENGTVDVTQYAQADVQVAVETEVVTVTYTGRDHRTNLEFSLTKGKIPKAFKIVDLAGEAQEDDAMIFNIIMLDELAYGEGRNAGNHRIGDFKYIRIDTIPTYIAQSGQYYLSTTQLILSHYYANVGFVKNHTYQLTCYYWDESEVQTNG